MKIRDEQWQEHRRRWEIARQIPDQGRRLEAYYWAIDPLREPPFWQRAWQAIVRLVRWQ